MAQPRPSAPQPGNSLAAGGDDVVVTAKDGSCEEIASGLLPPDGYSPWRSWPLGN